ncbi:MAG: hypothetical protein HUK08_08995, partial [Bacteroidaceae bacterium]|nr:hypothetical protein [Bacteroidaceae bacterium]
MITNCCIELYRYFRTHRAVYAILLLCLFGVFGYFSTQIHLEEDINKLMPSSKNPDGTTKLAFADLRIKDKTYLLFEGTNTDSIIAVCDAFIDSLSARDPKHEMVENVFYRLPDELMPDAIEYLSAHLPSFIDTACYASIDTMLTVEHFRRQMAQNHDDLTGDFGSAYPELIEMDPIGLRSLLLQSLMPATSDTVAKKGGYTLIDDHLFVSDSTVCLAFITPAFSATNTGQGSALFENLNELIASHKGSVKICYHGTPASGFYNASTIKNDLIWTVSGSLLIVLIFILFCFRRWEVLPLMVLPVVFGTLFSLTLMYM